MKKVILFPLLFFCLFSIAQQGEFKSHPNGLIYSDKAISKLKHIVVQKLFGRKYSLLKPYRQQVNKEIRLI